MALRLPIKARQAGSSSLLTLLNFATHLKMSVATIAQASRSFAQTRFNVFAILPIVAVAQRGTGQSRGNMGD